MCQLCNNSIPIYDPSIKTIVATFQNQISNERNLIITQENDDGKAEAVTIPISYCPWCGRKV